MKVQNKKGLGIVSKLFVFAAAFILMGQLSITANAQGTTKVTADSAKIRSSASTSSEVKASTTKDTKLDVLAQTQDSDGYTWYKVSVNGSDTGYIRADLVGTVEGDVPSESAQAQDTQVDNTPSTNEGQAVDFVQITDSTVTGAKVTGGSVNVRSNPSTKASVAGKATEGTEVAVSGEATDSDGKIWYQVSFGDTNGFIRSDFLEVTATAEEEEPEEVVEEPVEEEAEEPVKKEYEVVFEANPEGVEEWFLYDHNRGTKQSLADLLAVVRQTQDDENSAVAKLKTYKIIVIVMIAVILALIVGVTLLVFKLKDAYEYEYEDDDEDEDDDDDDDEDVDEDDDDDDDEDDDEEPMVRRSSARRPSAKQNTPIRVKSVTTPEKQEASSSWQSKNFLDVDDDMEFEFLDIK